MAYKNILITGGAGFVGSTLALALKANYPSATVTALDNFCRLGSRLNAARLQEKGVIIIEGDVRDRPKLTALKTDLIIDCAAEPSVLAGRDGDPLYVTDVNLGGTLNTLELARLTGAGIIFLSSSRIYPVDLLTTLPFREEATRLALADSVSLPGVSKEGITEDFPLGEHRTLYGATKLASELFVKEFVENFGIKAVINRCGVIAGPWQFGKVDQGFVPLWLSRHIFGGALSYIGFGGQGKQVRDVLHVDDLAAAIIMELEHLADCSGETYILGGGIKNSVSLVEMTKLCQEATGLTVPITSVAENRPGDIPWYVSDYRKFNKQFGWVPTRDIATVVRDTADWIRQNEKELKGIFS